MFTSVLKNQTTEISNYLADTNLKTEPYVTKRAKGTGLGLAIVKKIVEENDAEITLSNKTNKKGQPIGAIATIEFTNHFFKENEIIYG